MDFNKQLAQQSKGLFNNHLYNTNEPQFAGYNNKGQEIYTKPMPTSNLVWSPLYGYVLQEQR